MVPKLHAKGSSFRGAAAYLLHDKGRAKTAERLAWTETRNLATDSAQTAWRVMAATAMDQDRLKAGAGIKSTGRKSKDHVLHFTLSWHPDESAGVGRDEMLKAAHGAIRALKADNHQALIVAHNDEPQAHIHILLNRVNPADGRILPSSKEKLSLSRWAQQYEKERGRIYCEERVLNNAARDRGEFVRGEADEPRHLFEQKAIVEQEPPATVLEEQKRKDAGVAKKARAAKAHRVAVLRALDEKHRQRQADIRTQTRRNIVIARQAVREQYRPEWKANFHTDQIELAMFGEKEQHFIGRVQNALKAIDFGSIVRGQERRRAIGEAFQAFAQAGARLEALRRSQQARAKEIAGRQKQDEHLAADRIRKDCSSAMAQAREAFLKERQTLDMTKAMDAAALRAEWKTRREQRAAAWREKSQEGRTTPEPAIQRPPAAREPTPVSPVPEVRPAFTKAAEPPTTGKQSGGDDRAKQVEDFKRRMRARNNDRGRDRDRDR